MMFDNGGMRVSQKTLQELEADGWEVIDTFASDLIIAKGSQRMVVDHDGNIIIRY